MVLLKQCNSTSWGSLKCKNSGRVFQSDDNTCEFCKKPLSEIEVDNIIDLKSYKESNNYSCLDDKPDICFNKTHVLKILKMHGYKNYLKVINGGYKFVMKNTAIGAVIDEDGKISFGVVTEKADGGDLEDFFIKGEGMKINEKDFTCFVKKYIKLIKDLIDNEFGHNDPHLKNIVLHKNELYLIDLESVTIGDIGNDVTQMLKQLRKVSESKGYNNLFDHIFSDNNLDQAIIRSEDFCSGKTKTPEITKKYNYFGIIGGLTVTAAAVSLLGYIFNRKKKNFGKSRKRTTPHKYLKSKKNKNFGKSQKRSKLRKSLKSHKSTKLLGI